VTKKSDSKIKKIKSKTERPDPAKEHASLQKHGTRECVRHVGSNIVVVIIIQITSMVDNVS